MPGAEKLVVAPIAAELASVRRNLIVDDICCDGSGKGLLAPMATFMVKGWSRTYAAIACLVHAWQNLEAFKARRRLFRAYAFYARSGLGH